MFSNGTCINKKWFASSEAAFENFNSFIVKIATAHTEKIDCYIHRICKCLFQLRSKSFIKSTALFAKLKVQLCIFNASFPYVIGINEGGFLREKFQMQLYQVNKKTNKEPIRLSA